MTQKELALAELTRESGGLTVAELGDRTGVPLHSLRTIVWEMRKDGWIEIVGGVRGRYRYAPTDEGNKQAPRPPVDAVRQAITATMGTAQGAAMNSLGMNRYVEDHRRLNDFVRWLVLEKPELFATSQTVARQALEEAVADYVAEDVDIIRKHMAAALWGDES